MYAIYGNMDPINIPQMLAYIPYMDPMGMLERALSLLWGHPGNIAVDEAAILSQLVAKHQQVR